MVKLYFYPYLTLLLFLINTLYSNAQNICDVDLSPVCSSDTMDSQTANLDVSGTVQICYGESYLMQDVAFYYIKIQTAGTFTFLLHKEADEDFDFAVWVNPNCANLGIPDRASFVYDNDYNITETGLFLNEIDTCEGAGNGGPGDHGQRGLVKHLDVIEEDEIIIMVYRPFDFNTGEQADDFTISFGGSAVLDCTILGNSYGKCDYDNSNSEQFLISDFINDLQDEYPTHTFTYYLTQEGAENESGAQVNFPFTVNYNGGTPTEIFVRVENNAGVFVRVVKLRLSVNKLPDLLTNTVTLPTQCDPDGDGQASFNLTQAETSFVADTSLHTFKYYLTQADAEAGGPNNIPNPTAFNSGTAQIYVRINNGPFEGNEEGCHRVGILNLVLSDFNVPVQSHSIPAICDEDGDGSIVVNLTDYATLYVTDPNDYIISYHLSFSDANLGINPIPIPTNYTIPAGTNPVVYLRIKSLTENCFSVSTLTINTTEPPVLNNPTDIEECTDQTTGNVIYDLTSLDILFIANPEDFNVSYHNSQADANSGDNPIPNPTAYEIPVNNPTTIFIRIGNGNCVETENISISYNSNPDVGMDISHINLCDDDDDGFLVVDLTENEGDFVPNPGDYLFTYHLTQTDADAGTNSIPNPTNFQIPAGDTVVIFIRVKNLVNDCFRTRTITYSTLERPQLNNLVDEDLCVDQTTGNYIFDLTVFDTQVIANPADFTITWHLSQADADAGINSIPTPNAVQIPVNSSETFYVRVDNNGCFDTRSVTILINSNPDVIDIPNQSFCSTEVSGTVPYDLTQHIAEWVVDPTGLVFSYHTSQIDADNGVNPIPNPTNYQIPVGTNTIIYVRIQNGTTACFTTTTLTLFPGATATLISDLEIILCDENFDEIYNYTLSDLNPLLIANPNPLTFSYYLTATDAANNLNPIDSNLWIDYSFNSLPADIWVVAVSLDDCPSEPVRVRFVAGTEIAILTDLIGPILYCENEEFNLEDFEADITVETNVSFSYHISLSDAQNNLNALTDANSYFPVGNESIFVRMEKPSKCPQIVEIRFELLPTPSIELNQTSFELCPGSTFDAIATSDDPNATFVWYMGNSEIGTGPVLTILENGTYTVIVTGENGCKNETEITITTPPTPQISGIEVGPNYIIVSAEPGGGSGNLEFSLDGIFWQNSPRFDHLIPGEIYTVYVREDGCMKDSYQVTILDITNFVSPNGDGKNDTWSLRGIELTPQATIKIFDRYGKIFVDTNFEGNYLWDGKYLGRSVPSGDYWYILNVPSDGIVLEQKFVGHISVRN